MTREYIIATCRKYKIENYTINDDLSIDVKGYVDLSHRELNELPLAFNIVDGDFYCDNNKLTSLKGAPRKCRNFYCFGNNLTSLKWAPKCNSINTDYEILNLDNEELYVIEALASRYKDLQDYLKIRQRSELINTILDHD